MEFKCSCGKTILMTDGDKNIRRLEAALICTNQCDYPWRAGSLPSRLIDYAEANYVDTEEEE